MTFERALIGVALILGLVVGYLIARSRRARPPLRAPG